jgi:alanyl-tRNA synthetase
LALFGEKYGDNVRVLFMGENDDTDTGTGTGTGTKFSIELCGGTHVKALGDIGCFVIESETGVSSGIRRIEALTGQGALDYLNGKREITDNLSEMLKTPTHDICKRVTALIDDKKQLERDISDLKKKLATGGESATEIEVINGIKFLGQVVDGLSPKELAGLIDAGKQKLGTGIVVYVAINDDKVGVAVGVTKDLTDRYNAVALAKIASEILGGKGGGGRPDFAQAGGTESKQAQTAVNAVRAMI